jgi:hypothetical protein
MTEEPEASVPTARRAAQHFRLSSADDAYEHLYILTLRPSLARKIRDFRNTEGLAMVQIRCLGGFETKNEAFA